MTVVLLLAALAASPLEPLDSEPVVACRSSCARHVPARLMPKACAECLRRPDPAAWTRHFTPTRRIPDAVLRSALSDPLWEVRWGALQAQARAQNKTPADALYAYLAAQRTVEDRIVGCQVAAAAGALEEGRVLEAAQKACKPVREQLRSALEAELYLPRAASQEEALRKLMLFFGEGPARVVLHALRERPEGLDEVPALLLVRVAKPEYPVGRMLLEGADPTLQREMNRLLAVYSRQIDALRPKLSGGTPESRREALRAISIFLPMTAPEVEGGLDDPDESVAWAALDVLSDANERAMHQEVLAQLESWKQGKLAVMYQARAVRLAWRGRQAGCGLSLKQLWRDTQLAEEVRGAALAGMGRCGEGDVLAEIRAGLASEAPSIRSGAVRALSELGGRPGVAELTNRALADPSAEVVAEGVRTLGATTLHGGRDRAATFVSHEAPQVRVAAAKILADHARASQLQLLRGRVMVEPEPIVRLQLIRALARIGGPLATATLAELEREDPEAAVREEASRGLRGMLR